MTTASAPDVALHQGALLRIDKPGGPTSHDVVHGVRRHLGVRRVGHAGTLDPQATGLLVIGVGPATRLLGYIASQEKVYRGEMILGTRTDTMDAAGRVIGERPWSIDEDAVRRASQVFLGEILQRPPMVSAVKIKGQRLYRLAAKGIEVERPSRRVWIHRLDVLGVDPERGRIEFEVECSSGTYVRVLADEWGERLGTFAHLGNLRRLRVGKITLDGAYPAEKLAPRGAHPAGQGAKRKGAAPEQWRDLDSARLPWDVALSHLEPLVLEREAVRDLSFGRAPRSRGEEGLLRIEDQSGNLLGIAEGMPAGLPLRLRCVLMQRGDPR